MKRSICQRCHRVRAVGNVRRYCVSCTRALRNLERRRAAPPEDDDEAEQSVDQSVEAEAPTEPPEAPEVPPEPVPESGITVAAKP